MKKVPFLLFFFLVSLKIMSQTDKVFNVRICNDEYQVYMHINLYQNNIVVPGQELFGETPGYFGAMRDPRKWLITSAKITNDYGSEDLTATLIFNPKDGSYVLKQKSGSRMKIVVNRKWLKLPVELKFVVE